MAYKIAQCTVWVKLLDKIESKKRKGIVFQGYDIY